MKKGSLFVMGIGAVLLAALILGPAVPAASDPPSAWRVTMADNVSLSTFPKNYAFDPGRSKLLSYQFNYTCTTCTTTSVTVTVKLQCTIDEVKWRTLVTLVTASESDQDVGPLMIRMDDPAGDITTSDVLCFKYQLNFTAAAGSPGLTALNVSYFKRTGSGT